MHWENGTIPAELEQDFEHLTHWLTDGAHGKMRFLETNFDVRKDPRKILQNVESIISLVIPYAEGHTTLRKNESKKSQQENEVLNKTARYARVSDYHRTIKKDLDSVMRQWEKDARNQALISDPVQWRVATDSLPFLDRAHARLAGLGFIGKNTMLIRPGLGSFFFIAHILTNIPFTTIASATLEKPTAASAIGDLSCGECRKCLDICPTSALKAPLYLDSNRCLSYLTIEHREILEPEFIPHLKDQFYGCDLCQDVCPYNLKTSSLQTIKSFEQSHHTLKEITLVEVARMSQTQYEKWFGGTAMTRAKYGGLVRNALYSLHASNDELIHSILDERQNDTDRLIYETVKQLRSLRTHRHDPGQQ